MVTESPYAIGLLSGHLVSSGGIGKKGRVACFAFLASRPNAAPWGDASFCQRPLRLMKYAG